MMKIYYMITYGGGALFFIIWAGPLPLILLSLCADCVQNNKVDDGKTRADIQYRLLFYTEIGHITILIWGSGLCLSIFNLVWASCTQKHHPEKVY
jgi:hypothetical protein